MPNPKDYYMRIIAVANQKGGVGKSTSTINIASMLARHGCRVLIIDMDPQGHSTKGLGVTVHPECPTLADLLCECEKYSDEEIEVIIKQTYIDKLYVLPSNLKLALCEMKLSSMGAKEFKLLSVIQRLRSMCHKLGRYDFVFIDCPPTFTTLTINAFTTADEIIMPVQMSYFCMEGIDGFIQAVNFVNKQINPVIKHSINIAHVLITFLDTRTKISKTIQESVEEVFGDKIIPYPIPVNIKLGEAQLKGVDIHEYDPESKGSIAYQNVTNELIKRWGCLEIANQIWKGASNVKA